MIQPMLAVEYGGHPPKGWHVTEKFDGVRAVFSDAGLFSRDGNRFFAPDWFLSMIPNINGLDGELWCGRGGFRKMLSIAASKCADWSGVKFIAFDAVSCAPVENRICDISRLCESENFCVAKSTICESDEHLHHMFEEIKSANGEGLMLRVPGKKYIHGRSKYLQKLKISSQLP